MEYFAKRFYSRYFFFGKLLKLNQMEWKSSVEIGFQILLQILN